MFRHILSFLFISTCITVPSYTLADGALSLFFSATEIEKDFTPKETKASKALSLYNSVETLEIEQLRKEYEEAKARETSTANKLLTAATMAATGIGGMQLAQGMAEQKADAAAELDMKAYLATFTCRYADGKSVRGGTVGVELPGGNDLTEMVTEYKKLAADLKARKEALGMMPGIESEVILDKANTGLYDDTSLEKSDGAYTSLSKALLDENSEDAAEWAAQKESAQKKVKTGAIVGGVGVVGGIAGDLIINRDKDKKTDGTDDKAPEDKPAKD